MEQQICAYGYGQLVMSHDGRGRPGRYFSAACRKGAHRMREASSNVAKREHDVTKWHNRIIHSVKVEPFHDQRHYAP